MQKLTLPKLESEVRQIVVSDPELVFRKQDEFEVGQNPDGSRIGRYRNQEYAMFKNQINPLAGMGNVDLILTGSTKNRLKVMPLGNGEFRLVSTDWKWPMLVGKYGEQIAEVSERWFAQQQRDKYAPALIEKMKSISGIT